MRRCCNICRTRPIFDNKAGLSARWQYRGFQISPLEQRGRFDQRGIYFIHLALQPVSVAHKKIFRCAGQNSFQAFRSLDQIFDDGFSIGKSCDCRFNRQMRIKKLLAIFKCQTIGETG